MGENEINEFREYIEKDMASFGELRYYQYHHSDKEQLNVHNFIFRLKKDLGPAQYKELILKVNTTDDGSITFGMISFDCVFFTIIADD